MTPLPAFWSVHDVSPTTIDQAAPLVARLERAGITPLTILIVPAGDWPASAIDQLRAWAASGHALAAHGWSHRAVERRTAGHRLHSVLLSRDAAEHLSRTLEDVEAIVERSAGWFAAHDLPAPIFYVPPAWAAGPLSTPWLRSRGFLWLETLSGITDVTTGKHRLLPLTGFEADTHVRAVSLRSLNALNLALARLLGRPIRIAVHPNDERLLLRDRLDAWIAKPWRALIPTGRQG